MMGPGPLPQAILFDAGGTLILQNPRELSRRLDVEIDEGSAHRAHYFAMAEYSDLRLQGEDFGWDWWLERYFTLLGVPEPHLAGERVQHGYGLWNHPLEGVEETLSQLRARGVRLAVVSNSDGSVTESLAVAGLAGQFEFIIDSHDVGVSKPDPAIFQAALDRLDLEPSETWYVGDSVFHDLNGAKAAAIARAVLVDPYDLGPRGAHRVVSIAGLIG